MKGFTDTDIQDYLEGVFTGDVKALEDYIYNTDEGKKHFQSFNALFHMLQTGPLPSLNISLENKVMAALDARETKKSFNWNGVLWVLTGICIAAALIASFIFLQNVSEDISITPLIIIALVILTIAFHGIDWYRQYKRYIKLLG